MGATRRRGRRIAALLAVAALAGGIGVAAYATHLLRRTELQTIDARFSIRGTQTPPSDVVLVAIDQPTLTEPRNLGMASSSPFPRTYDATVIDRLPLAGRG